MSKFRCHCGEVIADQTDNLPYKGYILADTDIDEFHNGIARDIAAFVQARLDGTERQWQESYFTSDYAKCALPDTSVVHDIVSRYFLRMGYDLYQCSKCGRVHIEHREDTSRLSGFRPDDSPWRDVFAKNHAG